IRAGVKGVVVAGWEIPDDVAVVFAEELYRRATGGDPFGGSAQYAVASIWRSSVLGMVSGAWQVYGDSDLKLL
ncbi:MAG: hypothetical protein JJT93_16330, partial [Gammaproteobacteria bacterium]|nr:hypothetical protein [Gammaproteobacteria bacterium]